MDDKRVGRQLPTSSLVLPYSETKGPEAVGLYNNSGRTAQEWQSILVYDIMAVNDDGLYTHMKYGYSVPRRNGKSEILIIRAMYGLTHGERVLYTAHRTTTSHSAWEKVIDRLTKAGFIEGEDFKTTKQYGLEHIELLKGAEGIINFRTRSSKGGLGEGYDVLIIDEAQEYTGDQESALKYVVSDSQNPQTIMCGTPPTAVSSGTVFMKYRADTLSGNQEDCGWAEWSVPALSNAHDPELWYETNPSLGTILTERKIRNELGKDPKSLDDNIQRLGLWLRYNQKSAISKKEWRELTLEVRPRLGDEPKLYIGVKYAKGTSNVSAAIAAKTSEGRIFVEAIDCRPTRAGNSWLMPYLLNEHVRSVVVDGASGQGILADEMKAAGIKKKLLLPKISDIVEANALFEQNVFGGNICHSDQPSVEQIVGNCEHRAIGSGGGFGFSSILEGADVSLLDSLALAAWACSTAKEKRVQKVSV